MLDPVMASEAKQSRGRSALPPLDCFVAAHLAMTVEPASARRQPPLRRIAVDSVRQVALQAAEQFVA